MFPRSTGKAITRLALRASLRAFIIFSLPLARNRVNPGGKFSVDSIFSLYALYINFAFYVSREKVSISGGGGRFSRISSHRFDDIDG